MVLVQPSLHSSGLRYRWIGEPKLAALATAPDWLLDLARSPSRRTVKDAAPSVLPEGQRNSGLTRLAGQCRLIGLSDESLSQVLLIENRVRCRPPLPRREVEAIAGQAVKWSKAPDWLVAPIEFVSDSRLSPTDRIVLLALSWHANPAGKARPGIRRLAAITGLSLNTVVEATKHLEALRRLHATRSQGGNRYRLLPHEESLPTAAPPSGGNGCSVGTTATPPSAGGRW
jgi:hypothetical protein